MATKTSFNDYTAFGNIFRDGTLGVLISTGLLGTMVPNSIEAVGKVQELNSFLTLSLFSVIYFVFPIFIFTSYWLFRGERMFFIEKFSKIESDHNRLNELKKGLENKPSENEFTWIRYVLFVGKLVPLCVFIYHEEAFTRWGDFTYTVAIYYFVLAVMQNSYCVQANKKWLSDQSLGLGDKRAKNFQYWSYCVNALVFFLDIIIGLALVMFSKPWIFYSNNFYQWISSIIVVYALWSLIFSFFYFKEQRLRLEDFAVAVLLASAGLSFPSVNLNGNETIAILTFIGFVLAGAIWVFSMKDDTGETTARRNVKVLMNTLIPAVVVLIAAALFNRWMISGIESSNLTYMMFRFQASQQLSTEEFYPLSRKEKVHQDTALQIHKRNIIPIRRRNAQTWKYNPKKVSLRQKFFPKYVHEDSVSRKDSSVANPTTSLAARYFDAQESIDSFYNDIFDLAEDSITPSFFHRRYASPRYAEVRAYAHPLDYMGGRLRRLKDDKNKAEEMIELSEELLRVSLMHHARSRKDSTLWTPVSLATEELKSTASELNRLKKASPELTDDLPYKIKVKDTVYHARLVKFHKLYYEFCELKYIEAYKGAQKVYRSYLVDTQRIGVWAFFVTLLVLALATYFNNRARFIFQAVNKDDENTQHPPMDTPKNALFIQTVAIFILLVPLMKPIEPEHIDPEKAYWMISLQSWHTPSFFRAITDKDDDKHAYTPGRTVVVTQPPDFTELSKSIEGLSSGISESAKELSKIKSELEKIRTEAEHQDSKVKKR